MSLDEIVKQFSNLKIVDERELSNSYVEVVVLNEEISEWNTILTSVLDSALKPQDKDPSSNDLKIADAYGGIRSNQTLYRKDFNTHVIIAMFWPWGDQVHTTIKIIFLAK